MADARHVRFARELEARDEAIAAALAEVRALQADVEELRAHALAAAATIERHPAALAEVERAVAEARLDLHAREGEVAAAEQELARAKEGEAQAAARRSLTRAEDAAGSARKRVARVEEERAAVERAHDHAQAELPRLRERAVTLAARVAAAPRATAVPPAADAAEWAARARAALFVAAGSLETDRERVIREANELAAAALGDGTVHTTVALVRARLEQS
jgi:chromosome segregation ATPase